MTVPGAAVLADWTDVIVAVTPGLLHALSALNLILANEAKKERGT